MLDLTFALMLEIACRRGNHTLVWAMEHGIFDPLCYNDRAIIRRRIAQGY